MEHIVEVFTCGQLRANERLLKVCRSKKAQWGAQEEIFLNREDQLEVFVVDVCQVDRVSLVTVAFLE